MKVALHPGAEKDIEEAAAFYLREGSAVLAARFIAEFERLSILLIEHPGIGSPRPAGVVGCASDFAAPLIMIHCAGLLCIRSGMAYTTPTPAALAAERSPPSSVANRAPRCSAKPRYTVS